jgi:hypothetical protein
MIQLLVFAVFVMAGSLVLILATAVPKLRLIDHKPLIIDELRMITATKELI